MRLPLMAPADLTGEQRPLYEDMRAGIGSGFRGFVTEREDGAPVGPWNPWLHEPGIGRAVWDLTRALSVKSILPDPCRQIAILVTGAHFRAGYEIYAHVAVAQADGLSDETIATIVARQRPAGALSDGDVLPALNHRLAQDAFGAHGMAELIHLVGLYCMVSVTLDGFDVPVPDEVGAG